MEQKNKCRQASFYMKIPSKNREKTSGFIDNNDIEIS